jgi:hypothetical protein
LGFLALLAPLEVFAQALPYRSQVVPALKPAPAQPDTLAPAQASRTQRVLGAVLPAIPQSAHPVAIRQTQSKTYNHTNQGVAHRTEPKSRMRAMARRELAQRQASSESNYIGSGVLVGIALILLIVGIVLLVQLNLFGAILLYIAAGLGLIGLIWLILTMVFPRS